MSKVRKINPFVEVKSEHRKRVSFTAPIPLVERLDELRKLAKIESVQTRLDDVLEPVFEEFVEALDEGLMTRISKRLGITPDELRDQIKQLRKDGLSVEKAVEAIENDNGPEAA